jgi:hypothetical protein
MVQLDIASSLPITVPLDLSGSALPGIDYNFNQLAVVIPPGSMGLPLSVPIIDDAEGELDETILFSMGQPENAELGTPGAHEITILANDQPICPIEPGSLTFDADKLGLSWTLRNASTLGEQFVLQQLTISWPAGAPNAPKFDRVIYAGNTVFDGNEPHSPSTITTWLGFESYRLLSTGGSTVDLRFTRILDPGSYNLSLVFSDVSRTPNLICRAITSSIVLSTTYPPP